MKKLVPEVVVEAVVVAGGSRGTTWKFEIHQGKDSYGLLELPTNLAIILVQMAMSCTGVVFNDIDGGAGTHSKVICRLRRTIRRQVLDGVLIIKNVEGQGYVFDMPTKFVISESLAKKLPKVFCM